MIANNRYNGEGFVSYNLSISQLSRFNEIYKETKKAYPHLVGDDISVHRTKTLIAHSILTEDELLEDKEKELILDLDEKIDIQE